jgi:hypothetical protein
MTMTEFQSLSDGLLYGLSAIGALVLASSMSARVPRIGISLVAALWFVQAGIALIDYAPDCSEIPWWLWWWAGCAFLP